MNPPKTTKYDQENDKKLGQKHNQRSGTGLSQTGPRLPLLVVVVKDKFTEIYIIFLISHPFRTLNFSKWLLWKKSCRVERIKLVVNTNTINTYKKLQMLHSPFSIHFSFPLGTVKPFFVSERVTRADARTVRFDKILNFRATIVIQTFSILSEKCSQQSTLFESFSKHFSFHYFYVVKDRKKLLIIQLSTTPCNFM